MSKINRWLSMLLVVVMILSIVPMSAYAIDPNSGSEVGKGGSVIPTNGWSSENSSFAGIRVSLYFAEVTSETGVLKDRNAVRDAERVGKLEYTQIGDTIDLIFKNTYQYDKDKKWYTSNMSVYDRMHKQPDGTNYMSINRMKLVNDASKIGIYLSTDDSLYQAFLKSGYFSKDGKSIDKIIITNKKETVDKDRWNKFFVGESYSKAVKENTSLEQLKKVWESANITNLMRVIDKITEKYTDYDINEENFKKGELNQTDKNGKTTTKMGIYKFYFEPLLLFRMDHTNMYVFSLRDAISHNTDKTTKGKQFYGKYTSGEKKGQSTTMTGILSAGSSAFLSLARAAHLVEDEPMIAMSGAKSIPEDVSKTDTSKEFYQAGGVGVITGAPFEDIGGAVDTPKVVITYVKLDSIDADGTPSFSQFDESKLGDYQEYFAAARVVEKNRTIEKKNSNGQPYTEYTKYKTISPKIDMVDFGMSTEQEGVGLLNDIITVPYTFDNLNDSNIKDVSWVGVLPEGLTEKVGVNDIVSYKLDLLTKSDYFIKQFYSNKFNTMFYLLARQIKTDAANGTNIGASLADEELNKMLSSRLPTGYLEGYEDNNDYTYPEKINTITKNQSTYSFDGINRTNSDLKDLDKNNTVLPSVGYFDTDTNKLTTITDKTRWEVSQKGTDAVLPYFAPNTLILRYIVIPVPKQINIIKTYQTQADGSLVLKKSEIEEEPQLLCQTATGHVDIVPPTSKTDKNNPNDSFELVRWVTNCEYPIKTEDDLKDTSGQINLPQMSLGGKEGADGKNIQDYPQNPIIHNLYVEWRQVLPYKDPIKSNGSDNVPEWRLSKRIDSVAAKMTDPTLRYAEMSFTLGEDNTTHVTSTLKPSGNYNFYTVNANSKLTDNTNSPANTKWTNWFHSSSHTKDSDSITHINTFAQIAMDATLNMIKSTDDNGGLVVASWVKDNKATLADYDIKTANLPTGYSGSNYLQQIANMPLGIYNKDTYQHEQARYSHDREGNCHCYTITETFYPTSVSYKTADYKLTAGFNRYIAKPTTKFQTTPVKKESNTLTTLKYQLGETIKVYPEYGMLFTDDAGKSIIKFTIGEQGREISPVVYQTLEHKVYVTPTSNGSSVATDTRALNKARSIKNTDGSSAGNKQVIYKGAAVNTNFAIGRAKGSNAKGIMTVKTFALDFKDKSKTNNVDVKSVWGNSGYNSYDEHKSLLNSIKANSKATITEKLLVENTYTGGEKKATSKDYSLIKYNDNPNKVDGGNAVVFTHELIIRGGKLIGIRMMDRSSRQLSAPMTIEQLKGKDEALYTALVNMNLYDATGNKANTVLASFEHKADNSAVLSEQDYGEMLNAARAEIDGFANNSDVKINAGDKWYSEDTTVLVVKEYVSNFEVPSTAVSDKLPMTIPGLTNLATPQNKAQYFSQMGRGYTYLKYNLLNNHPYISGEKFNTFFEYSSNPNDAFANGVQGLDYLVPNVSITDTMTLN